MKSIQHGTSPAALLVRGVQMKMTLVLAVASVFILAESVSAQMVMDNEPPPGQLGAGQVVYVSCGSGKARKVTGGSNIGPGGQAIKGRGRQYGPCVAMAR